MAILICGGAGYIGSHINKLLSKSGYQTVVFDNLIYGHKDFVKWGSFVEGDLANICDIENVFNRYHIDAVFHMAAYAYVGESVSNPEKYYYNNVVCTLNLLSVMKKHGCNRIIFSSTCATYGDVKEKKITESVIQIPINPYGKTKLMVERIFEDYQSAYGLQYVVLRYFNAAGADPEAEIGEKHIPETHLIPLVLDAAAKGKSITVFGNDYDTYDGTCVRDYIHVFDLASAHILALKYLEEKGKSECFNLSNENGISVLEIINTAESVTGIKIKRNIVSRRDGDPAVLIGDSTKAKRVLGWKPQYSDINLIIRHAWNWYLKVNQINNTEGDAKDEEI